MIIKAGPLLAEDDSSTGHFKAHRSISFAIRGQEGSWITMTRMLSRRRRDLTILRNFYSQGSLLAAIRKFFPKPLSSKLSK